MSDTLIEFDRVSLVRGSTKILDSLQLRVPRSQHIAILGPNGSGKSTLLKLLMRFFYPSVVDGQAGEVRILGKETWNVWELRKHLGFVSSEIDHHFMVGRSARLTARQAILSGFTAGELEFDSELVTPEMESSVSHWLHAFEMEGFRDKPVGHMSTGERRRILLARALVFDPSAIILDEPTSGLDLIARSRFLDQVTQLAMQGKQIVLVTHHFEEILQCMDRIVLLKQGKVFFDGDAREALTSQRISDLYDAPVRIGRDATGRPYASLQSSNVLKSRS